MHAIAEQCTTVLVGAWNRAIFTPEWVSHRIFDEREVAVALQFTAPFILEMRCENVRLQILPGRVQLASVEITPTAFEDVKRSALRLLQTLRETPLQALGINFAFQVTTPPEALREYMASVRRPLAPDSDEAVVEVRISEARAEGRANVLVRSGPANAQVELNYHWDVQTAEGAQRMLLAQDYTELLNEGDAFSRKLLQDPNVGDAG